MRRLISAALLVFAVVAPAATASACPFCRGARTLSEEIAAMDVVVVARLLNISSSTGSSDFGGEVTKGRFLIAETVKGESLLSGGRKLETIYFGDAKPGQMFLIMGTDPDNLIWSTPMIVSDRAREYIKQLGGLPKEGPQRLVFFQDHLEDQDEMLARDAYDEFARAPYKDVKALKPQMKREQLVEWINDPDVPASRRRLYFTMLGVCGGMTDLAMLEAMLKSDDRKKKAGLDALIACYLTIHGEAGMPLIEELFLKNKESEYADTYAAIMAIRFHGNQNNIIPRKRLLVGLRHMLDRPELADLVIPDLARWEDWEVQDRLVELFKNADEQSSWVRVPVINYLRACPKPEAKERIKALEKIDPAAVRRARIFFPYKNDDGVSDTK